MLHISPDGQFSSTLGVLAVFAEQLNVFEGRTHDNIDDSVRRFWVSGLKTMPLIGWEGHDGGEKNPNVAISLWSGFGECTWISTEEAAKKANKTAADLTPETFQTNTSMHG